MTKPQLKPEDRVIVALDVDQLETAEKLVRTLVPLKMTHFKIGFGLFTRVGPQAVEMVHRQGGKVFLDLKFHDIPSTVARAVRSCVQLGVWMTNLHIQGGSLMMKQAMAAVGEESKNLKKSPPLLIGVTVLTSMAERDLADLGVRKTLKDQVLYLAKLAQGLGLNGIVASPQEATVIRWACGDSFLIVTPGIRPKAKEAQSFLQAASHGKEDQQRWATPLEAVKAGSDYLVVGRPILEASDPAQAVDAILSELQEGHHGG